MNATGGRYDLNITRLMADYPDFIICGNADGWMARVRGSNSRASGPWLEGTSLDELAAKMDAGRRLADGA